MFHSTIYGNRIYTPRSSRASHIHRLSERFPFVAASSFKANGEAIRSLGACHGIWTVVAGPGAQYRPPAAMRPFSGSRQEVLLRKRAPRMRPTKTLWQIESSIDSRIGDGRCHCGPPPWGSSSGLN
jgi:hypothetical protein